ncbi:hypothetical protein B9Z19DRAFT_1120269 [Tuber borchii]|uniref:Uncharacterized protein n=1 Tax=Tuber borchii TaxID=42251 RepID=A0A2T7A4Q3_TUBBO|nr:hypothetical protein B9Z19DRAFT_1120269 [Tuber borchii]
MASGRKYFGPAATLAGTVVSTITVFAANNIDQGERKFYSVEEDILWELRHTRTDLMKEITRIEHLTTDASHTQHPRENKLDTALPKSYPSPA